MSVGSIKAGQGVSIRELKENVSLPRAQQQTQKDGLDEIYVEGSDGKNYAVYGASIDNISQFKPGDAINLTTSDGKHISGTVSFVDDEATSVLEGAARPFKSLGAWVGIGGAGATGAVAGAGLEFMGALGAALGGGTATVAFGAAAASGAGIAAGLVGSGIAIVGGIRGALNSADESRIQSLVK